MIANSYTKQSKSLEVGIARYVKDNAFRTNEEERPASCLNSCLIIMVGNRKMATKTLQELYNSPFSSDTGKIKNVDFPFLR